MSATLTRDTASHPVVDTAPDGPTSPSAPARAGRIVLTHVAALLVAGLAVALRDVTPIATFVVLAYLVFFPGDALMSALRVRTEDVHVRILFAAAGSTFMLILAALVSSMVVGTLGAPSGLAPLAAWPMFVTLASLVVLCLVAVAFSREQVVLARPTALHWLVWGILAIVVQGAWIGAKALDMGHGPWIAAASLAILGALVVWATVSTHAQVDALRPTFLFFLTLGIAWSFSQRTDYLYGFDLHQEYLWAQRTLAAGVWERVTGDPYAAMLSITALPASLASLSGLEVLDYFKAYAPIALALYPVGMFAFIARFASRRSAYVVTLLAVLVPQALWQVPAVSRQEVALLQFAALTLLMFGAGGRGLGAKIAACCAAVTLAATHYTSAYVALAILAGGFVISWGLRALRSDLRGAPRHLPALVVTALVLGAVGWNVAYTQSSGNLGSAVERSGDGGLRHDGGPIETFLNGANVAEVAPEEYFAETLHDAEERDWSIPYSNGLQQQFVAETREIELPEQYGPAGSLENVSVLTFVLIKQGSNVLMALGVIYLAWRLLLRRNRRTDLTHATDLLAVATVALAITAVTRFNAELSQAYNPERLLLQTAFFLGAPAALLGSAAARSSRRLPGLRRSASSMRLLPAAALTVLAALLALDATGLRALLIHQDSGNLQPDGEYARRFDLSDADLAAASWLGSRFASDDMVFADTYGALAVQGMPAFKQGLFPEISPFTLDQRAYVFATTENVHGGRTRAVKRSVRSTFEFPERFLSTYKSRVYSNGSAEVYR